MNLFKRVIANSVFFLNILVLFLLIFHERLEFPLWIQSLGRMHPLLLHIPIGIIVLLVLILFFQKYFDRGALDNLVVFILYLSSIAAAVTAFMGLVLAGEGGYNEDLVTAHMITGVALSFLSWLLLVLAVHFPGKKNVFNVILLVTFTCLILTGHLGASITHGENFVLQPFMQDDETAVVVTDSTTLYDAAIYPVLKRKCTSCHNEKKAKGELIMTSLDKFMIGGEDGSPWIAYKPESSLMMKRILLPEDNDDHMPPSGKPQLTREEIELLHQWIQSGADTKTAWTLIGPLDTLRKIADPFIHQAMTLPASEQQYTFESASEETVSKLNTPFLNVSHLSTNEPALKADFFLRQAFDKKKLNDLLSVKEQLIELNLSNMPVTDEDCKVISQLKNLERLNLNNTDISGNDLSFLKELEKLQSFSVAGTKVNAATLKVVASLPSLKEVFIWNSEVKPDELAGLRKVYPSIIWNTGFAADEKEVLRLTPPIIENETTVLEPGEGIRLKNNLPGTVIRYTLDGTEPDSTTSPIYKDPIQISGFARLKARATKDKWLSSRVIQQYMFVKGFLPTNASLINQPEKDYKGEGITTLINNKKGTADNFRDIAWLGYRYKPFEATFYFQDAPKIKSVTLSYAHNIPSFLMPPASVEVWGGDDLNSLKLIRRLVPDQPKQMEATRTEVIAIPLELVSFKYYKVIAHPVAKLPQWHSAKGEKAWIFLDEIFFN